VSGQDTPEDGERGGVAAGARVVGYGRRPRSRRTAVANLPWRWCEEVAVAVARQPQRHSVVSSTDTLSRFVCIPLFKYVLNSFSFFEFIVPNIC
jgi:hypothetical protein